jgi:hypothetical protein
MKQSDLALIIVIIAISLLASFFVGNAVFNKPQNRTAQVEVVKPLADHFPSIDSSIFNKTKAVNLTENIKIGDGKKSTDPFKENNTQ